jgi:hypothetical protein
MENLMDDELRGALEMTKEELLARRAAGAPAEVRKREDFSQRMLRVMQETVDRPEAEPAVTEFKFTYDADDHVVKVSASKPAEGVLIQ